MEFSFNVYNSLAISGETLALKKILPYTNDLPIIICIGSDLSIGDSLGPTIGTTLQGKLQGLNCFIYVFRYKYYN